MRVFAFRENPRAGTPYRAVDPADIVEIKKARGRASSQSIAAHSGDFRAVRIRVHGAGSVGRDGLDHVLVVQMYRTPEMDYFSPKALPFLTDLVDRLCRRRHPA